MSDEDVQRLVMRGLIVVLILLVIAIVIEGLILLNVIHRGGDPSAYVEAAGLGTIGAIALAIIGVIATWVRYNKSSD